MICVWLTKQDQETTFAKSLYKISKHITSLAPEREIFSEPAKSTKFSLPHFMSSSPSVFASLMCIVMEKRECERLKKERALLLTY